MEIGNDFQWHSVTGFDFLLAGSEPKKEVKKVAMTKEAMSHFVIANEFLIHKTSRALWKISDDGKSIEAVFEGDVLTEDQI